MIRRVGIALFLVLAFAGNVFSQAKLEGPKEGTVGYRVKAKLTVEGDDPKIACFPANEDWMAIQDFSGQKYIDFVPGKKLLPKGVKSQLFTFIVACNKDGKTYLATWEVTIKPDEDTPSPPEPAPPEPDDAVRNTSLYKALLAAYKVSPNSAAKGKLTQVYETFLADVKADKFKSFKEAHDALKDVTPKFVGTDLTGVRSAVAEYLDTNVGQQGSAWDKNKLVAAMEKVIAALKKVPD